MRGRCEAQPEVACRSYRQFVFIIPKNILLGIFSALIIVTPVLTSLSDVTDDHPHGRKRVFLQVLRVILCGAPLVVDDGLPVGSLPTRPRCIALRAASFLPLINRLSPRIAKAWPRPVTSVHPRAEAPPPSLLQDNRIPGYQVVCFGSATRCLSRHSCPRCWPIRWISALNEPLSHNDVALTVPCLEGM